MSYIRLKSEYDNLLRVWQRDMKRMFLLAHLAKDSGIDLDWVLKADEKTVLIELSKRPQEVHQIVDPLKPWTPPDDWHQDEN